MYILKTNKIYASEIAEFINSQLHGRDILVYRPCSFHNLKANSITILKEISVNKNCLSKSTDILIITDKTPKIKDIRSSYILSANPELDYLRIVRNFFVNETPNTISSEAIIEKGAKLAENVHIGAFSYISPDATIGKNTIIGKNVVINGIVHIGRNTIIKDNSIIGSEGFDFEYDESGIPQLFPHLGRIIIQDNVWIGSNTTIERPVLDDTLIQNNVKIDDMAHIGRNCNIGSKTLITAGVILSNDIIIGKNCWISPNSSIKQKIIIGNNVLIGLGSVVIRDVKENTVLAGNPAIPLKDNKNKKYKFGQNIIEKQ